ncbi:hypothetical protein [Fictibacillus macauensis]|uniref:hypothetical protein n=1 Tax=Fictibacillus macauensis TaxID=245160 RepID=UPI0012E99B75|nr:hypothetical protein [Fictibacillus macauensis]
MGKIVLNKKQSKFLIETLLPSLIKISKEINRMMREGMDYETAVESLLRNKNV